MQKGVLATVLLGAVAGCHAGAAGAPDSGPGITQGLAIAWSSEPATIPGAVRDDLTVSSVVFRMANVRVIGDAGPGDPRTTAENFAVEWKQGTTPDLLAFMDAPSGLYSRVNVLADGQVTNYSYEIYGTVRVSGNVQNYRVRDSSPLNVSVETQTNLEPGMSATTAIRIDLDEPLINVRFDDLSTASDGTLELTNGDDQLDGFRQRLTAGFVDADSS
jgi:hypothetical protein